MISILLAVHNGEKYLRESIESILNQSYEDWELLIGLNASTDTSKSIIESYKDKRIKLFEFEEKGKSKTLNKLLQLSKGEWIALQDDDDIWLSDKLESQLKVKSDVIGSKIHYINELGNITGSPKLALDNYEIVSRSFNGINQVANTSAIFKKSYAVLIGGWNEDLDGIEDYDFWLRLMKFGAKFTNVNNVLVHHRIHKRSNFNTKQQDIKALLKSHGL